ncbi:Succinate-semialdehyde dehydrogenase, mitochondrial [Portunus trituberculatus]|uniref:Succinate-semialdehyde dehydrogenase, mitochondrial n=1 Tax=Portunus trituberculatus TaxID=210409 RepID=A0A5B7DAN0_PORTR|nr:Succinate-semialdehyde dehydrogenase, mitochondrial [Portunus trituberculatus]
MGEEETQAAIDAAHTAFQTWHKTTAKERSGLLRQWYNLVEEHKEDLARLMVLESGKPLVEARGEISYGSAFLEWYSEEARRIYGEVVQSPVTSKEMVFIRRPIGVASMITPWNFPNAMITRKAGAALAAGCTCVVKPAEDTPFSALALAELAEKAGIPPGVVNVVTASRGNTPAVGNLMCSSPKVAGVFFTGSTGVGKLLYNQCAQGVKRIGLELGGNAPFIVFNSASVKDAVAGLMVAKFRNAGQVEKIVQETVACGAQVVMGGSVHSAGECFFQPTILTGVTEDMRAFKEEIFGPVIPIKKFETEEEALKTANATQHGLASYFYSQDVSQLLQRVNGSQANLHSM